MPNYNLYATLSDYKAYKVGRNQTASLDGADDAVIVDLLEKASRYIDEQTTREFYPVVQTRLYDIPQDNLLWLDADLLAVITLTNGDATTITTTDYSLLDPNLTPYYALKLKDISAVAWESNSSQSSEQVISLKGFWGHRRKYSQRAWVSLGTLGAAISDTTTLAFTMTADHSVVPGHIVKIDNELYNINTVATNTVTPFQRGDNGSDAATHSNGATVYGWNAECAMETLALAVNLYEGRFGRSTGESATVTAAGVVITPKDIPTITQKFIDQFKSKV